MKKQLFLLSSILTVGALLTACGSPNTAEEDIGNAPEEAVEEVVDEETDDSTPAEEVTEGTEEDASAGEDSEESDPPGTLTQSEEQNYELYLLDGYALTAEEPKKDALYAEDNSAVFMRIETFTPEEADFTSLEESMKQTLAAVNPDEEPAEATNFDGSDFKQASAYEVPSTEGTVTGIVYEKENLLVRLTIFDDSALNATEDFIAMGKTIELPEQ
ncbi:hypothetical protein FQV26_05935 [Planococcus sp. CPCC 101016]|uniref:hypothetical protein n=1 Tax=Planococcus sp. CPCC 101016 TaxID=2599617 RepID=UPI0011B371CF|nr:hypothetical protein [Planococcus sp. CPCC 101016]TWT07350.1 hypothetical protein FQV26_05935 [Planococcus sp. CPCC 101016]